MANSLPRGPCRNIGSGLAIVADRIRNFNASIVMVSGSRHRVPSCGGPHIRAVLADKLVQVVQAGGAGGQLGGVSLALEATALGSV